jgi:hypothetical protein
MALFTFNSRILSVDVFQQEDTIDKEMERDFNELLQLISGVSDTEIHATLQSQMATQNARRHMQIINALLYGVLVDPAKASEYYTHLSLCVWDNFHIVVQRLKHFTGKLFLKLQNVPRNQVFWLLDMLLSKQIGQLDSVMLQIFRGLRGLAPL